MTEQLKADIEAIGMPETIYIQLGENRIGTEICLCRWQKKPFEGGTKYIRETEWVNLAERMPPIDKEFVFRKAQHKHIQNEAIILMESDGYFSPDGGKPYPVLYNLTDEDDICDDEWSNYEWMEIPNE